VTTPELVAAAAALAVVVAATLRDREGGTRPGWLLFACAVAAGLLFSWRNRPRVLVHGPGGAIDAVRVAALAVAIAAGLLWTARWLPFPHAPRRGWTRALVVVLAAVAGIAASLVAIL